MNNYNSPQGTQGTLHPEFQTDRTTQIANNSTTALSSFVSQVNPALNSLIQNTTATRDKADKEVHDSLVNSLVTDGKFNVQQGDKINHVVTSLADIQSLGTIQGKTEADQRIEALSGAQAIGNSNLRVSANQKYLADILKSPKYKDLPQVARDAFAKSYNEAISQKEPEWQKASIEKSKATQLQALSINIRSGYTNTDPTLFTNNLAKSKATSMATGIFTTEEIETQMVTSLLNQATVSKNFDMMSIVLENTDLITDPTVKARAISSMYTVSQSLFNNDLHKAKVEAQGKHKATLGVKTNVINNILEGKEISATDNANAGVGFVKQIQDNVATPETYPSFMKAKHNLIGNIFQQGSMYSVSKDALEGSIINDPTIDTVTKQQLSKEVGLLAETVNLQSAPVATRDRAMINSYLNTMNIDDETAKYNLANTYNTALSNSLQAYYSENHKPPQGEDRTKIFEDVKTSTMANIDNYKKNLEAPTVGETPTEAVTPNELTPKEQEVFDKLVANEVTKLTKEVGLTTEEEEDILRKAYLKEYSRFKWYSPSDYLEKAFDTILDVIPWDLLTRSFKGVYNAFGTHRRNARQQLLDEHRQATEGLEKTPDE